MLIAFWSTLSMVGILVTMWYISAVFNPYGRLNYPMFLWKNRGHYISWLLIIGGMISLIGLYISSHDLVLFLNILLCLLIIACIVKAKNTPLRMPFKNVMGSMYSASGLRFGGFQTSDFLTATEILEKKHLVTREKIVAETNYLVFWLHEFPEVAFFLGIIFYKNIWAALLLFVIAFIVEIIRFYLMGASEFLSKICRFWRWIKLPVFVITALIFWSEGRSSLSLILAIFLIIQGWLNLVVSIGLFPIRLITARIVHKRYGAHWHNMEGMAMSFVINKWKLKLFPTDKFNINKA